MLLVHTFNEKKIKTYKLLIVNRNIILIVISLQHSCFFLDANNCFICINAPRHQSAIYDINENKTKRPGNIIDIMTY